MLLYLQSKEEISLAKEHLVSLGVEHHLLPTDADVIFEINADQSIFPPRVLAAKLRELGRVEHNGAKTPLLDEFISQQAVSITLKSGKQVLFQNFAEPVWIAGPCSIDTEENLRSVAATLKASGTELLRGGAVKPRTSPHEFQGVGRNGYKLLAQVAQENDLGAISEALSEEDVEEAVEYLDIVQVGARNMQNFALLKKLGRAKKPVLLKRAPGATLREWASAAEYLLAEGNKNVVLCERGVRGLERELRYTLDLAGAAFMQHRYCLPMVIDPSHATGVKQVVEACTAGALAMGFAGVMLETHPKPCTARSDALQALTLPEYQRIVERNKKS